MSVTFVLLLLYTAGLQLLVQPRSRCGDYTGVPDLESFVEVNQRRVWTASVFGEQPHRRGVNTMILDPVAGLVSDVQHWDTSRFAEAAENLAVYLDSLPSKTQVGLSDNCDGA